MNVAAIIVLNELIAKGQLIVWDEENRELHVITELSVNSGAIQLNLERGNDGYPIQSQERT